MKLILLFALMGQLQGNVTQHQVTMKWNASPTKNVVYAVGRATKSGGPYTVIKSGLTTLTYQDKNVVGGQSYYYVVGAYFPQCGSKCQSKPSNQVKVVIP